MYLDCGRHHGALGDGRLSLGSHADIPFWWRYHGKYLDSLRKEILTQLTCTTCKPEIRPAESHTEKYVIGLFMRVFLMAFSACNNINFCWLLVLFLQYKLVTFSEWTFQIVKGARKEMKRISFIGNKVLTYYLIPYIEGATCHKKA